MKKSSVVNESQNHVEKSTHLNMVNGHDHADDSEVLSLSAGLIEDEEGFKQLEDEWDPLLKKANGMVYTSFDWLFGWWQYFGKHPKRDIHIITIREQGKLVCIAPYYSGTSSILGFNLQKRLRLMGDGTSKNESFGFLDDYGRSDFLDIICDPNYEKPVAEMLYSILTAPNYADTFDVLQHSHINDRSFIKRKLIPLFEKNDDDDYVLKQTDICPSVTFEDTFEEDYLYKVSSNTRRRLRQSLQAIGEEDGYIVEEVKDDEELEKNFNILMNMHQSQWNNLGYTGAFLDNRFGPFLLDYLKKANKKDTLWFKVAKDQGGFCALRVALKFNGRFFDYMSGFEYDAPSSKYRPGIGLLTLLIKEGTEDKDKGIELLRGDERYKYDFTDIDYKNWKWTVPLQPKKNFFSKLKNSATNLLAAAYYRFDKERDLLKVQRSMQGTVKMFFKYYQVRYEFLKERLTNT